MSMPAALRDDEYAALRGAAASMRLIPEHAHPVIEPLTGGVSSLIAKLHTSDGIVCLKQALPRLKVAADWFAPPERNAAEIAWLREAHRIVPGAVPRVLGEDARAHCFALEYLDPARYRNWKICLRDGQVDPEVARRLGTLLGLIHAGTAARPELARTFAHDAQFHALRLEPYLQATALAEPDVAAPLRDLAARTAATKLCLVHGDISPKNILIGANGEPIILDAECAWYGDPAFDLAFCLNHLLLKCAWRPSSHIPLVASFQACVQAYMPYVVWEAAAALEVRVANLLPGLLLARLRGKSPVEYLPELRAPHRIAAFAKRHLRAPVTSLQEIVTAWSHECDRGLI